MIEIFFAGFTLAVCAVLAVRLLLGEQRRWRFDAWVRRRVAAIRRSALQAGRRHAVRKSSAEAADAAIRRARGGRWDGNVYRPRTFKRPRKPH